MSSEPDTHGSERYSRLPLTAASPICPSVQRALSACGGSAKAQRAEVEAKTPALDAPFCFSDPPLPQGERDDCDSSQGEGLHFRSPDGRRVPHEAGAVFTF